MALLVGYVLSIGPAAFLYEKVPNTGIRQAIEGFYFPLIWLAEWARPAEKVLVPYVEWWIGLAKPQPPVPTPRP